MNIDISGLWRLVTSAFGTNYPMRLAIGVALACLLQTGVHVLAKSAPEVPIWQALNELGTTWYLVIVTPLMFVTIAFGKQGAPEGTIRQINIVKSLIAEGGFTSAQRVMIWRALIEKYLTALQPDLSGNPKIRDIFDDVQKDFTPGASS